MISLDTIGSNVIFNVLFDACSNAAFISSFVGCPSTITVKSTTEPSIVGTLKAEPLSFPSTLGRTFPIAFAAPVSAGIIFYMALLPLLE